MKTLQQDMQWLSTHQRVCFPSHFKNPEIKSLLHIHQIQFQKHKMFFSFHHTDQNHVLLNLNNRLNF